LATKKRILITSGPTWVAIDKARVISNIASGETGFILADQLKKSGFEPTLLLGPGYFHSDLKGIKIIRFNYFLQLEALLKKELKKNTYAGVIQAAAVSDYRPDKIISGKISSSKLKWQINLLPTRKLLDSFKGLKNNLIRVGFKYEPDADDPSLIKAGVNLLKKSYLDLVVANSNKKGNYRAYIIENNICSKPFLSKAEMAKRLVKLIEERLK